MAFFGLPTMIMFMFNTDAYIFFLGGDSQVYGYGIMVYMKPKQWPSFVHYSLQDTVDMAR